MTEQFAVERVARALCAVAGGDPEVEWHIHSILARAAISAMREPTELMANVGSWEAGLLLNRSNHDGEEATAIYQAMIDAALAEGA